MRMKNSLIQLLNISIVRNLGDLMEMKNQNIIVIANI